MFNLVSGGMEVNGEQRIEKFLQKYTVRKRTGVKSSALGWDRDLVTYYSLVMAVFLLWVTGCATAPVSVDNGLADCRGFWQSIDEAIACKGVGDGYAAGVAGFAYLRADCFPEALGQQADTTLTQRVFIEQMRTGFVETIS